MFAEPIAEAEPLIEISSVQRIETSGIDQLFRGAVDTPRPGTTSDAYGFTISGWALHPERRVASVQVIAYEETVGWAAKPVPRSDIAEAFPNVAQAGRSGFHVSASVVGLPLQFECVVEARLDDGRRIPFARVEGRRSPVASNGARSLQPLLVTSLGRSGSTYLMALLSGHPAIVVDRGVPYENRTSAYWAQVFKILSRPANHAQAGHPDSFAFNRHFVGQNPFNLGDRDVPPAIREWYGRDSVERLAAFVRETVDSFYGLVAAQNGQNQPAYYAEKRLVSGVVDPWLDLYRNGREIFLIRDFRDMLASILAFNAKRGYQAFGRENASSDEEYVHDLEGSARAIHDAWRRRGDAGSLVRYEELVTAPRETLPRILAYLNLESSDAIVDAMIDLVEKTPELREHRTTGDATSSIGRWKTDLDDRLKTACDEAFGPILAELGYAIPVS